MFVSPQKCGNLLIKSSHHTGTPISNSNSTATPGSGKSGDEVYESDFESESEEETVMNRVQRQQIKESSQKFVQKKMGEKTHLSTTKDVSPEMEIPKDMQLVSEVKEEQFEDWVVCKEM